MNHIKHLPLSFRTTPRRMPRNRYNAAAVAVMRRHRRACRLFTLALILLPVLLAGLFKLCEYLNP